MVDITIESEALEHGALAAEGRLEKSSFKFRSEGTDTFRLTNRIRKAIPDLRPAVRKPREEKTDLERVTSNKWR